MVDVAIVIPKESKYYEKARQISLKRIAEIIPGKLVTVDQKTAFRLILTGDATPVYNCPEASYYYARKVLNARYIKGEPAILQDPHWTYYYITDVIKNRWPEGEPTLRKEITGWDAYRRFLRQIGYDLDNLDQDSNIQ